MSTDIQTPKDGSADVPADVNKRGLWPLWLRNQEWREELSRKAAHKSLDIPEDEMNIINTKTGIGTWGAMGIAAAAGLPGLAAAGVLAFALLKDRDDAPPASMDVGDSEYEVLFYDRDGNPISIPHISTKASEEQP